MVFYCRSICEVRWNGAGKMNIVSGETIIYAGTDRVREKGVGILVTKDMTKTLMEWTPFSGRSLLQDSTLGTRKSRSFR